MNNNKYTKVYLECLNDQNVINESFGKSALGAGLLGARIISFNQLIKTIRIKN